MNTILVLTNGSYCWLPHNRRGVGYFVVVNSIFCVRKSEARDREDAATSNITQPVLVIRAIMLQRENPAAGIHPHLRGKCVVMIGVGHDGSED
jgi:hypothetical protein